MVCHFNHMNKKNLWSSKKQMATDILFTNGHTIVLNLIAY